MYYQHVHCTCKNVVKRSCTSSVRFQSPFALFGMTLLYFQLARRRHLCLKTPEQKTIVTPGHKVSIVTPGHNTPV